MAKQTGMFLFSGTIDNINGYASKYGHIVRKKTRVDGKRIARDPAFKRTRENANEFGNASAAGSLLRRALQPLLHKGADGTLPSRLTAAMARIVKTDPVGTRGNRKVSAGHIQMLKGFELNANAGLEAIFSMPVETRVAAQDGLMDISITSFMPEAMINFPPGATHFSIVSAGIALNFEKKEWRRDIQKTGPLDAGKVTDAIHLVLDTDTVDQQSLFLVLGIEFYQELNGNFYPLHNGGFTALMVKEVVKLQGARDKEQGLRQQAEGVRNREQKSGDEVLPEKTERLKLPLHFNYNSHSATEVVKELNLAEHPQPMPSAIEAIALDTTCMIQTDATLLHPGWHDTKQRLFLAMRNYQMVVLLMVVMAICQPAVYSQVKNNLPQLVRTNGVTQLYTDGKPFLILGGELGNSSASDIDYMRPVWPKLKQMHLNTVLAPVYWELLEPAEGEFDFTLVDSMLAAARQQDLKLVLLWFGSWKNSMSCYAPEWIKTNQQKFERARNSKGNALEILSAFNSTNLQADINAFTALMKHIAQADAVQHTVLMVQVENEIGMLTDAREYTNTANAAFHSKVPAALINYLQKNRTQLVPEFLQLWQQHGFSTNGSWEEIFGKGLQTDELFQAWQYAVYANAVAEAGKKAYPIPMFINAALNYRNVSPGQYPSAGPLPHLMDIWQAGAPQINFLSPDFYNPYFRLYCDLYIRRNNPFFIPEIRAEPNNAAKVFYAIGHYNAMGFSPFSIESAVAPMDEPVAKSYSILQQLAPFILQYQVIGKVAGVLLDSASQKQEITMGNYKLTVVHEYSLGWSPGSKNAGWPESGGLIIQTSDNEFIIAGTGIVVSFSPLTGVNTFTGILSANEGEYIDGKWKPGRRMNGDQDHQGRHIRIAGKEFGVQQVRLYDYQ